MTMVNITYSKDPDRKEDGGGGDLFICMCIKAPQYYFTLCWCCENYLSYTKKKTCKT